MITCASVRLGKTLLINKFKVESSFGPYKKRPKKKEKTHFQEANEVIDVLWKKRDFLLGRLKQKSTRNSHKEISQSLSGRKRRTRDNSKIILNFNELNVPPLGHYKPDYDFVKPRISSTCFSKSSERKTIFDAKKKLQPNPRSKVLSRMKSFGRSPSRNTFIPTSVHGSPLKPDLKRCGSPLIPELQSFCRPSFEDPESIYLNISNMKASKKNKRYFKVMKGLKRTNKRRKRCFSAVSRRKESCYDRKFKEK
ncbi:unnamed protein product [Moneuplotes crassus]|uniref:Uncharacterized protein n=1 Tax=Euplotes crassus TaxID=5936 RepID=A0AAD2CZG7_EUPCR|nr:unnamed protein product [Moneuplotes crassus]